MKKALLGILVFLASANCGELTTLGDSPAYLIIQALDTAPGTDPEVFLLGGDLNSDVVVMRDGSPTILSDYGRARFLLGLKDPGSPGLPTISTTANAITVTRYRVRYIRADGRNTPGVDVPYGFDGAVSATVQAPISVIFTLVRVQAKLEPPLAALATNLNALSTIAEVTFYGHDQTGREVTAVGNIGVHFANFADPF